MKPALQLVRQALAGPMATTPTSRMVKLQDGRLWGYGGTFCLSTPVQSPLECAFKPAAMEKFFSIDRPEFTMTRQDDKLILKSGNAEDRIPVIPADEVPVLQAVGQRYAIKTQPTHLATVARLSTNDDADFTQFAWLEGGFLYALKSRIILFSVDAFPPEIPKTGIPSAAMLALSKIKSPMTSIVRDEQAIQFEFEDGTWLASRHAVMDTPNFMAHFDGMEDPQTFKIMALSEGVVEEIMARDLYGEKDGHKLDMIWHGEGGTLQYIDPDNDQGIFTDAYTGPDEPFRIKGSSLREILSLEPETLGFLQSGTGPCSLNGLGDGWVISARLSRL